MGRIELLWRSFRKRGVLRTLRLVAAELAFDLMHGTETGRPESPSKLEVHSTNLIHGEQYQGANPSLVRDAFAILKSAGLSFEDLTLVDYGSGKGRVMVLAAEAKFRRIIGVEYSQKLCAIATRNLALASRRAGWNADVCQLVCEDAASFDVPDTATIFFFFNPFTTDVMESVVRRIATSYARRPRDMYALYLNPAGTGTFERVGFKTIHKQDNELAVFHLSV